MLPIMGKNTNKYNYLVTPVLFGYLYQVLR